MNLPSDWPRAGDPAPAGPSLTTQPHLLQLRWAFCLSEETPALRAMALPRNDRKGPPWFVFYRSELGNSCPDMRASNCFCPCWERMSTLRVWMGCMGWSGARLRMSKVLPSQQESGAPASGESAGSSGRGK